jgi:hypothetical protein
MPASGVAARGRGHAGQRLVGLGRILVLLGVVLIVVGVIAILMERMHVPLGRLPGDMSWRGRGWSVSFPLMTCVVVSVVLSLVMWLVSYFRR